MKTAPAEQPDQADDDQIYCDDVVQQTRHKQDENAGDQRNQPVPNNGTPASSTLTVPSLAAIPTLSEWAMIMLTALLAVAGFAAMRRRQAR